MQTHRTGLDPLYLFQTLIFSALFIGQGFGQLAVVLITVCLTFIASVIGYYVLIKFTPISWVVNGYRKSWLELPAMITGDGKRLGMAS